jgi:mannose-6-phosphate isomerase-like protein (cupin superfamily)
MRSALLAAVFTLAVGVTLLGARTSAQSESVTYYDVSSLPWTELRPGIRIKPIVGQTATFALDEFDPLVRTSPHHHTHEQAHFGLQGSVDIVMDGVPHSLSPEAAVMVPPDAEHAVVNTGGVKASLLEFQPVRRLDLLPPRQQLTFPSSAEAVPILRGRQVSDDFNLRARGWSTRANGARVKTLIGEHCALIAWDVPATQTPVDLRSVPSGTEVFAYLVKGHGEVIVGSNTRRIEPGTLLVISHDAAHVLLRAIDSQGALIVEFDPVVP